MNRSAKVFAVIPAKESTGIPGKNQMVFGGRDGLEIALADIATVEREVQTLVVTADPEFHKLAVKHDVPVIVAPEYLMAPEVGPTEVVRYGIAYAMEHWGIDPDCIIETYACHPTRTPGLMNRIVETWYRHKPDLVCGVYKVPNEFHPMYYLCAVDDDNNNNLMKRPFDISFVNRQSAGTYYTFSHPVWCLSLEMLLRCDIAGNLLGAEYSLIGVEIDRAEEGIDLNTMDDVRRAEDFFRQRGEV